MSASFGQAVAPDAPASDPFDPVALEARLTEARARRALALSQKAASDPAPLSEATPPADAHEPVPVEPARPADAGPARPAPVVPRRWPLLAALFLAGAVAGIATTTLLPLAARTPPDVVVAIGRPGAPAGPGLTAPSPRLHAWTEPPGLASLVPPVLLWTAADRLATVPPPRPGGFSVESPVRASRRAAVVSRSRPVAAVGAAVVSTIARSIATGLPVGRSVRGASRGPFNGLRFLPPDDGPAARSHTAARSAAPARPRAASVATGSKVSPAGRSNAGPSTAKADRGGRDKAGAAKADRGGSSAKADRGGRSSAKADRGGRSSAKADRSGRSSAKADRSGRSSAKADRSGRGNSASGKGNRGGHGNGRKNRGSGGGRPG